MEKEIFIPNRVGMILDIISSFGYEAFIVGGCVRDSLLGKTPEDWDITTDANPMTIMNIFKNKGYSVIPTGLKHGTVTLLMEGEHYEITTYRVEGDYEDNRRPSCVEFTPNLIEDLSRRDFTINAMAYNHIKGLIDPFNGYGDLQKRIIKCVGDPIKRFQEDALRIMRAIRFMAQLSFEMDYKTRMAIKGNAQLLKYISKERIRDEFSKIIMVDKPSKFISEMIDIKIMLYIIPEINECMGFDQHSPYHYEDLLNHILRVLDNIETDLILRLAALFHDMGKPQTFTMDDQGIGHFYGHSLKSVDIANKVMKRLRYDNKTIGQVLALVKEHMYRVENLNDKSLKRFINRVGIENLEGLFKLQIADRLAIGRKYDDIIEIKRQVERILKEKEPLSKKDLKIDGSELLRLGISPGKDIGRILNELLEIVIENPKLNEKKILEEIVKNISK